jgi:hypothetical protein
MGLETPKYRGIISTRWKRISGIARLKYSFHILLFMISKPDNYCPGIEDFVRPNVKYNECETCGGRIEVWSDEEVGNCIDCGTIQEVESPAPSCLNYCEYADQCKGIIMMKRR